MSHDKPTTRLEDTPVVDDGDVDMAELSKSGVGARRKNPAREFLLGFATALFLFVMTSAFVFFVAT